MLLFVPEIEFLGRVNAVIIGKNVFSQNKHYNNMELSLRLDYSD